MGQPRKCLFSFRDREGVAGKATFDPAMYRFTQDDIDLDELRERLSKMTDAELIAFGEAARRMCSRATNLGKPPREAFVIQLREARAEWKRRRNGGE